jgi:alkylation response protein AidB-like acyl-CoA dehydrogenase
LKTRVIGDLSINKGVGWGGGGAIATCGTLAGPRRHCRYSRLRPPCADQAVQILGGIGFMRGTTRERLYREVKVMIIGCGSEAITKGVAARQLGI